MSRVSVEEKIRDRARKYLRARRQYERQYEREIEKEIARYRAETPRAYAEATKEERPRAILAEGDSWARYVIGFAVPWHLDKIDKRNRVMNVASPGDTASEMLTGKNAQQLGHNIKRGPGRNRKFDVIFFSGGGNDLLGDDRFATFLNTYKAGMTAAQMVNRTALNSAFKMLQVHYSTLVRLRDANSPKTHIYFNAYDFAVPTGKPACGFIGPWLKPHLQSSGAPPELWFDIVSVFLKRYSAFLKRFAASAGSRIVVLETQGTLVSKEWDNEIHPTKSGFRKIAQVVQKQLVRDFP